MESVKRGRTIKMALNENNQEAITREEVKKNKKTREKKKRIRVRLIPIWLRIMIVILLLAASVVLGAMFGYAVMGGGEAKDVFEKSTWTHIMDLVNRE
jgi:predicted histidine transporter YuiF (NhaC family)